MGQQHHEQQQTESDAAPQKGGGEAVPVWSLLAAVPTTTGFVIIY